MAKHLQRDLESLKKEILILGSMVEDAANKSILALMDRRIDLVEEVIEGDRAVDIKEVHIEEDCLKILALHQPVAIDLRFVVAMMKVNNDLERVGDLAGNIASRARFLAGQAKVDAPQALAEMADGVRSMLRESLNAVVNLDTDLARKVLQDDDAIDKKHASLYALFQKRMQDNSERVEIEIQLLSVSRYLERMADLATNIAEDVVFMVDGEVVRHQSW